MEEFPNEFDLNCPGQITISKLTHIYLNGKLMQIMDMYAVGKYIFDCTHSL